MKALKKIVLAVLVLPVLIVLGSFLLPSRYHVERSVVMKASPEAVFEQVNRLKHWPEWTAWTVTDYPDMKIAFAGPESGVGAVYSWEGKSSGNGTLKITASEPGKRVSYSLDFENGKHVSAGALAIEPDIVTPGALKVTWHNAGDLGANPVSRIFGLLMDRMMGPDFEKGLHNLKTRVEARPAAP